MIKGYLRYMSVDLIERTHADNCCINFYMFECDDGTLIEEIYNDTDAPINVYIGIEIEDDWIVSWDYLDNSRLTVMDEMVKDIALVRVVSEGKLSEAEQEKVNKGAKDLEDYFKQMNDGLWTHVSVTPYLIENIEGQPMSPFGFNYHIVRDRMEEQHPDKFEEHTYWHGWGGVHDEYLGMAGTNGRKCWTWAAGQRTMRHEQGHCFGCPHSTTPTYEYGDPTCNMAKVTTGFNANQMIRLGHIRSQHHKIVDDEISDTFYLCPVEVSTADVRQGEIKSLHIDRGQYHTLGLSTRKAKDQSWLGIGREGDVSVHEIPINSRDELHGSPVYLDRMREGDTYEWNGVTVRHAGMKDGVVKLKVNSPSGNSDYPAPLPTMAGDELTADHSAIWHAPEFKYQGIDFHVIPDRNKVIGYWFTHHPQGEVRASIHSVNTSRQWYVVDGDIDPETNVVNCKIYSTKRREIKEIGHGTLRLDGDQMKFRFYSKDHGRDGMILKQLSAPKDQEISGIYETGEYEGFSVGKYDDLYVAYRFTYRLNDTDLEWIVYQGEDITELTGYRMDGRYKISYDIELEEVNAIDLQDTINNATKVY